MSKLKQAKGLGRGFDTLIPKDLNASELIHEGERIQNILISDIKPSSDQPRTHFDESAIKELAASIKRHGILQPIVVTPIEQNMYAIVAGERRWRAAQIARLERVPAIIRTTQTLERLEIALIENVQRVDLSPLEQAVSIERLHQQFNMTYIDIAARLGKAATTVNNIVRLLQLPAEARTALHDRIITEGHARAILALKDKPGEQATLLDHIINEHWSVRQAEQFVVTHKQGVNKPIAVKQRLANSNPDTERLAKKLSTNVQVRRTAHGGKLEISFKDDNDFERIINLLP